MYIYPLAVRVHITFLYGRCVQPINRVMPNVLHPAVINSLVLQNLELLVHTCRWRGVLVFCKHMLTYMYTQTCAHTCTHKHLHAHTCTCMYTQTLVHVCVLVMQEDEYMNLFYLTF